MIYIVDLKLKVMKTFVCYIILFAFCLSSKAQTTEPTLQETLDWISSKINLYGGAPSTNSSYGGTVKVDKYRQVSWNFTNGSCDITYSFYLTEVKKITVSENGSVWFYMNDKLVKKKALCPEDRPQDSSSSFGITMNFYEEDNLAQRFAKACNRLVSLLTKDQPKEAF